MLILLFYDIFCFYFKENNYLCTICMLQKTFMVDVDMDA